MWLRYNIGEGKLIAYNCLLIKAATCTSQEDTHLIVSLNNADDLRCHN